MYQGAADRILDLVRQQQQVAAQLADEVAEFDRAGLWELDGATSMTAWLKDRAQLSGRQAARLVAEAKKASASRSPLPLPVPVS